MFACPAAIAKSMPCMGIKLKRPKGTKRKRVTKNYDRNQELIPEGKRKGLFGAGHFQSGKFIFMETPEKFNGDSYLQFIRHLLNSSNAPVILIEDGAPYHRSSHVREFQKIMEGKGLPFTYRLPSFMLIVCRKNIEIICLKNYS